jgi:hypothetical protein
VDVALDNDIVSHPTPSGTGIFLRALTPSHQPAAEAAVRARDHGLSWIALMAIGLSGDPPKERTQDIARMAEFAQAFREAGIDIWVWLFPLADAPEAAANTAIKALGACHARGLILDIERPYRARLEACRRLVGASSDGLSADYGIAVTSHPLASYHPCMPWSEMAVGTGMPQTYKITAANARRAVREWRERGHRFVVPIGPAFGEHSRGALLPYLRRAFLDGGKPIVEGIGLWSWPQMEHSEWRAIEKIAAWWA